MLTLRSFAFQPRLPALLTAGAVVCAFAAPAGATVPAVPLVPGDAFHYSYTQTGVFQEPGIAPGHYANKGTFTVTVSGGASFAGRSKLAKLHYSGFVAAVDEYVGFTLLAGGRLEERTYGSVSAAGLGITTKTIAAGAIQNEYPETKGLAWSPAAESTTLDLPGGKALPDNITSVALADGSYHWSERQLFNGDIEGGSGSLAPDGSGKVTWTTPGYNAGTLTFGTPVPQKTGFAIPVTSQGFNKLPQPPLKPTTIDVPDWFPGHALPWHPLLAAAETNNGGVITPADCGLRAGLKAFDLRTETRSLDPLTGLVSATATDEFDVAGLGNVCTISKTVVASYENTAAGNLLDQGTMTTVVVLTGISGPKPAAQAFSMDVLVLPIYDAIFSPTPVFRPDRSLRARRSAS